MRYFDKDGSEIDQVSWMELWSGPNGDSYRRVRLSHVVDLQTGLLSKVSTVWLGIDAASALTRDGVPEQIFETMVIGVDSDGPQWRYSTILEAIDGHRQVVEWLCSMMAQPIVVPGFIYLSSIPFC